MFFNKIILQKTTAKKKKPKQNKNNIFPSIINSQSVNVLEENIPFKTSINRTMHLVTSLQEIL